MNPGLEVSVLKLAIYEFSVNLSLAKCTMIKVS